MTNINPKPDNNSSSWQSLQDFRTSNNLEELEMESDVFTNVRDKTPGRIDGGSPRRRRAQGQVSIDETTYLLQSPKNAQRLY